MLDAAAAVGGCPPVLAPSAIDLVGPLLAAELKKMQSYVAGFHKDWEKWGCTVMCDGWTSPKDLILTNFLVHSNKGTIFSKFVEANGNTEDSDYLFELMDDMIERVGAKNVVHIVTDNIATYRTAGRFLTEKWQHIFWSPCVAHSINLIIKELCEMAGPREVLSKAQEITAFIYNDQKLYPMMKFFTRELDILHFGPTLFATHAASLESLASRRLDLKKMFSSKAWYRFYASMNTKLKKVGKVIELRVFDDSFWKKVDQVIALLHPLFKILVFVGEGDRRSMGFVHDMMYKAKMAIQANFPEEYKEYWVVIAKRWDDQITHLLYLASWFLNP
ncbi:hypothetical protein H6P81_015560 [Aristolochia fimbriata]|uniref:DUF659 domain-containing protein n=1 Tax=Aristolochia fimbriata TaxID=158543 RepID=A0AAV7E7Z6_ARIFI|nr:hypothetical protein H6P81_015560 [Aristolochia fimbriata]